MELSATRKGGFTLVEMISAVAVLLMLSVLLLSILGGASTAIQSGGQRQEATSVARTVFGRLAADLAGQIRRPDISYGYSSTNSIADSLGNDQLSFYTETTAFDGDRGTSLVAYKMGTAGQLERGVLGLAWMGDAPVFLGADETGQIHNRLPAIPSGNFQALASGILRFEICFLNRDSTTETVTIESHPPARVDDLIALVVAIAVLDGESGAKMDAGGIDRIGALLPDPAQAEEPSAVWQRELNDSTFADRANVPTSVISQIRIQQRYFPLQ